MNRLSRRGFTLVELMVAAAILAGTLVVIVGLFFTYFNLMEIDYESK